MQSGCHAGGFDIRTSAPVGEGRQGFLDSAPDAMMCNFQLICPITFAANFHNDYVNELTTSSSLDFYEQKAVSDVRYLLGKKAHSAQIVNQDAFGISTLKRDEFKNVVADSTWAGRPGSLETVLRLRRTKIPEFLKALIAIFKTGDEVSRNELTRDRSIFKGRDDFGTGALHALFVYDHDQAFKSMSAKEPTKTIVNICQYLIIENGMDARAQDNYGSTPLHWAFRSQAVYATNIDRFQCLLELGSNDVLGISSRGRMTPLHWVVARPSRHAAFPHEDGTEDITEHIMRSLLQYGADIQWKNSRGITVLQWASRDRGALLQTIYSGLDGIQLIRIRQNADVGYSSFWEQGGDSETESPGGVKPIVRGPHIRMQQRDVGRSPKNPEPVRVSTWVRIKRRLRLS
ncbi:hypothetical protein BDP55DRAFT_632362 [Colletotrichum godetiae]|uniref:Ankyrin repeat protein n=1 Tax=Colletotrichum godetiae TaxID=1209918 RepID=A0AAJ0EXG9_9PEZI|nr:uncharacterized protein BDP55DRAFT_632362 [Colletotrichum godetiae]KAK1675189.1 hypothetical protein BDP55DRAFT_632362 [Colletotrichum godetiae]